MVVCLDCCEDILVVGIISVRTVVVRKGSLLAGAGAAERSGVGKSPAGPSPTLQNDVVQRQAVTPMKNRIKQKHITHYACYAHFFVVLYQLSIFLFV